MTEEFFFAKSHIGTPLKKKKYTRKTFSLTGMGIFARRDPKKIRYDQRPSDMILGMQGNFCELKLL